MNGRPYNKNFIKHSMLKQGGRMEIFLVDQPTSWGSKTINRAAGLK
jgi:putative alpha-1,2-mannosidase